MPLAAYIKQELDLDYALAHDLEVDENMLLTGRMVSRGQRHFASRGQNISGTLPSPKFRMTKGGGVIRPSAEPKAFGRAASSTLVGDIIDPMRKVDLMLLLADKAKIEPDGIIVVGNYVHPDYLFEHGGTRVHFNSSTCNDFRMILYLFGIRNHEARQLMRAQEFREFVQPPSTTSQSQ